MDRLFLPGNMYVSLTHTIPSRRLALTLDELGLEDADMDAGVTNKQIRLIKLRLAHKQVKDSTGDSCRYSSNGCPSRNDRKAAVMDHMGSRSKTGAWIRWRIGQPISKGHILRGMPESLNLLG